MAVNVNAKVAKKARFKQNVVAVCDSGPVAVDSLELGRSFTFTAIFVPPTTVLFRLLIPVNETTLLLQFIPQRIEELRRIQCDDMHKADILHFDDIGRYLGNARSFTRLQFQLSSPGDLITPKGFDLNRCDAKMQRIVTAVVSLATATTFSIYMARDALPHDQYQIFYGPYKNTKSNAQTPELQRMANPNGVGGVLFDYILYDRLILVPEVTATTVTAGSLPGSSPPTVSQQSMEHDSNAATVAVSTPSGLDDLPPPYVKGAYSLDSPGLEQEDCKHIMNHDGQSVKQPPSKKRKLHTRIAVSSPPSPPLLTNLAPSREIRALRAQIENHQYQIDELEAAVVALQKQNADLEERHSDAEDKQGTMAETLDTVGVDVYNAQIDLNTVQEELRFCPNWQDMVEEFIEGKVEEATDIMKVKLSKYMEEYMSKYMEDKVKNFKADLKSKIRSALDD